MNVTGPGTRRRKLPAENSWIQSCGKEIKLFGESHIDEIAKELSVPVLGKLPLDTSYAAIADKGDFYSIENDHLAKATEVLERI